MNVLVTFALREEFAPWRRLRPFRATGNKAYAEQVVEFAGAEIRVVLTGAGPNSAQRVARAALAARPDICISSGLAGGLKPEHDTGDVLVGRTVRACNGDRVVASHARLVQLAEECGATPVAAFGTTEEVLISAREKAQLNLEADAVEMESLAVMTEAEILGVPCVAIRAVSDSFDEDLPIDFNRIFTAQGQLSTRRVVRQLARRPHRLPALVRLSRKAHRAALVLANFLERYVRTLAAMPELKSSATRALGMATR